MFILNHLYKKTNHYKNEFVDCQKFIELKESNKQFQIVNLGSNHPKFGFDYTETAVAGANWAVGPQTFEYDFAILKQFHRHIAPGGVVVIPVCLLKCFLFRQANKSVRNKYYTFLDSSLIHDYSPTLYKREITYPLFYHPKKIKALLKDSRKDNRLALTANPMNEEALKRDANFWMNCWNREFKIDLNHLELSDKNKKDIADNIALLNKMIEFCLAKGLKPVITLLPVTNYLSGKFHSTFVKEHVLSYIQEANKENIPILNYLTDERFTAPELYINSFFFNQKGRKLFTVNFVEDLKKHQLL